MRAADISLTREDETQERLPVGLDLVFAGSCGLFGVREIAVSDPDALKSRFFAGFLQHLERDGGNVSTAWFEEHSENGIVAWEEVGDGGVFAALWNFSGIHRAGIRVELKKIPLRQITVEICELYGLNPYRLKSDGCVLAAVKNGAFVVDELQKMGIESAVIGRVIAGSDRRIVRDDENEGFLERPKPDELEKFWKCKNMEEIEQ